MDTQGQRRIGLKKTRGGGIGKEKQVKEKMKRQKRREDETPRPCNYKREGMQSFRIPQTYCCLAKPLAW